MESGLGPYLLHENSSNARRSPRLAGNTTHTSSQTGSSRLALVQPNETPSRPPATSSIQCAPEHATRYHSRTRCTLQSGAVIRTSGARAALAHSSFDGGSEGVSGRVTSKLGTHGFLPSTTFG